MAENSVLWLLGLILILSSLGILLFPRPVHASLSFLVTLLTLALLYLQLSAQFIAVMQVLIYAGAILVIFMFVIILFQDAYQKISQHHSKSPPYFLFLAAFAFVATLVFMGWKIESLPYRQEPLPADFGTVQALGKALYVDFFFPFEAVTLLFLIAAIGALYIGKKA